MVNPVEQVAAGYRAMDERRTIKTRIWLRYHFSWDTPTERVRDVFQR
jgi:hypothetical protein